jgi:AcrR family transcriptional regulator
VARRVVERDGLAELSLTRLGKQLGAGPTSIYWYFESMDGLLAALVDDVTQEMYLRLPPIGDGPWDEEIIEHHVVFRRLLQRTPIYREVFSYRSQTLFRQSHMAPFILDRLEEGLALLLRAGLTPEQAVRAHSTFSVYTRAFVLIEEGTREEEMDPDAVQLMAFAIAKAAPELSGLAVPDEIAATLKLDEDRYRLGLQLIVDGIRRRYLSPKPAAAAKGTRRRATRKATHGS